MACPIPDTLDTLYTRQLTKGAMRLGILMECRAAFLAYACWFAFTGALHAFLGNLPAALVAVVGVVATLLTRPRRHGRFTIGTTHFRYEITGRRTMHLSVERGGR